MNEVFAMILLFLPAILVACSILIIQIQGDFFELRRRVKHQPKVSITVTLTANHEKNVNVIKMVQSQNYKNIEIVLLANASYKKALGQMKYYRKKHHLSNLRILTGKVSKRRAREGNVQGRFVLHMPPGNHELAKNSLSQTVAQLQTSFKQERAHAGVILIPALDTTLKSGLSFTFNVLAVHLARAYSYFPARIHSVGFVSRMGEKNPKRLRLVRQNKIARFVRWVPSIWLVTWVALFGSYAIGSWAVVAVLLIVLGFFAQLNLRNHPLHTRLSIILLTPLVVLIPVSHTDR